MLELILPTAVAYAESFADVPESTLLPAELEALGAARHEGRRREFTTVRHCARRALADLGVPPVAVLPGERGAPVWPQGVVGSMTHCAGYRAAAVASRTRVRAVGIDAEPHEPLPGRVLGAIARAEERERLAVLTAECPQVRWDRLLFCVKESVYKAWFPMTRRRLGFADASVSFDRAAGTFRAELVELVEHSDLGEAAGTDGAGGTGGAGGSPGIAGGGGAGEPPVPLRYEGRWTATPELLLAATVVPADPAVRNRLDYAIRQRS
ncbi:4'-phosphopantetheinyl transferase family protein [Streptomyces sp. WM6368]|uniref:4'-phosphopantetheinyl transferase family protein n=1 Tax=Streptomyces sp. WM6368 TaxID=1415554 RepID=UPI0006AE5ADD|nr:4'-phosphopantetheinyl transferase superfamily protein [Streptomyces sp. WM6368]